MTNKKTAVVQPYLFFNGKCEEAVEFYKKAMGAEVQMMLRYDESPEPAPPGMIPPGFEKKIMHSSFLVGQTLVMASDGCSTEKPKFEGFSLSIAVSTPAEVDSIFNALAEGGEVGMPLAKTFWSPRFGMVTDKFGVGWMITVITDAHKDLQFTKRWQGTARLRRPLPMRKARGLKNAYGIILAPCCAAKRRGRRRRSLPSAQEKNASRFIFFFIETWIKLTSCSRHEREQAAIHGSRHAEE